MENDSYEYFELPEPNSKELNCYWKTAIGLQEIDGLKSSDFLISTAEENIKGNLSLQEAKKRIDEYYGLKKNHSEEARTEEADKVALRITEMLSERAFSLSPVEFISIHKRLFEGIYDFAGEFRTQNIGKKEWVLNNDTVIYSRFYNINNELNYEFNSERNFNYTGLELNEKIKLMINFISNLWRIHPFAEGNTRTTAVFTIQYLRFWGHEITSDSFAKSSLYFRNALVRANYTNDNLGISATKEYLGKFFENLLNQGSHALGNQDLHINKQQNQDVLRCAY